jgi:hypothetical protein
MIARLPDQGIAVAVMTNEEVYGHDLATIAAYRIFDDLLGLKPIDWETRLLKHLKTPPLPSQKFPINPHPATRPASLISGAYHSDAYGKIQLSQIGFSDPVKRSILQALPEHFNKNPNSTFFAGLRGSIWAPHLVFTHWDRNLFNWTAVQINTDHSSPKHDRRVKIDASGPAIITAEGIGLGGNLWSTWPEFYYTPARFEGDEARHNAPVEVWFERQPEEIHRL